MPAARQRTAFLRSERRIWPIFLLDMKGWPPLHHTGLNGKGHSFASCFAERVAKGNDAIAAVRESGNDPATDIGPSSDDDACDCLGRLRQCPLLRSFGRRR